jgi:hypothetical protein
VPELKVGVVQSQVQKKIDLIKKENEINKPGNKQQRSKDRVGTTLLFP